MIGLSKTGNIEKGKLTETEDINEAAYMEIVKNSFKGLRGCNFTEGQLYEISRRYGNPFLENGDAYLIDDDGVEFGGWGMMATTFYK